MKTFNRISATAILLLTGVMAFTSCEGDEQINIDETEYVDPLSYDLKSLFVETEDLSEAEVNMLLFMKEEEKLARDVYFALYEVWGSRIFTNIAASEQRHLNAVTDLVTYYGIGDSTVSDTGIFINPELQTLYDTLVAQGSQTLEAAMTVGATIEDLDINDLNEQLLLTENENIIPVFNHLIAGSENHLRAFIRQLENRGVSYEPQFISQELFDEIISSSNSQVPGKKQNRKGQKNKGQGKNKIGRS